jgi:uncharacterized protein YcsI (UPF0317 family)
MIDSQNDSPSAARAKIRAGKLSRPTSGVAPGYVQANIAILPSKYAFDFLLFCQRNPTPCPLLAVSDVGSFRLPDLGDDIDIRSDLGRYRILKDGVPSEEVDDIQHLWNDDFVVFALGCSFSFEEALLREGLTLHHHTHKTGVAMYLTNIPTKSAGRFSGNTVVSMRAFDPADAITAIKVTSRFPRVHGAPIHIGMPKMIGISDIRETFGGFDAHIEEDQLPLFWACGVTAQLAIEHAAPPIAIVHSPGYMLVTDVLNTSLEN